MTTENQNYPLHDVALGYAGDEYVGIIPLIIPFIAPISKIIKRQREKALARKSGRAAVIASRLQFQEQLKAVRYYWYYYGKHGKAPPGYTAPPQITITAQTQPSESIPPALTTAQPQEQQQKKKPFARLFSIFKRKKRGRQKAEGAPMTEAQELGALFRRRGGRRRRRGRGRRGPRRLVIIKRGTIPTAPAPYPPPPGGVVRRPRCVIVRRIRGDGSEYLGAVDEHGNEAELVGVEEDAADFVGDDVIDAEEVEDMGRHYDDDDDYEGDDEDLMGQALDLMDGDDEDEDILGQVEDAINELTGVMYGDEHTYGDAESRLETKIDRIQSRIDRVESKPAPRQPFRRLKERKRQKRLKKLNRKRDRAAKKLADIRSQRAKASQAIAAAAAAGGVGTGAGVMGTALATRQGQGRAIAPSALVGPQNAHALRMAQAQAGLIGQFVAPPGSGRLNRIPMYTSGGTDTNPRQALTVPAAGITGPTTLTTEDIPFALIRLVGFVASIAGTASDNNAIGLVQNLRIKGGTNLFMHDGNAPAAMYDTADDKLRGLRAYPEVRSPNQAFVDVRASGDLDDVVILTAAIVADVLADDTYGAGFPGAYSG